MGSLGKLLKKLDINPSTEDSFKERTITGALISVITVILMASLFWGEFKQYMNYERVEDMIVDKETTDQTRISISIDFHFLPCDLIQVGYSDALGNDRSDFENEILKTNLDVNGNPIGKTDKTKVVVTAPTKEEVLGEKPEEEASTGCGDCFGAGSEGDCCNTCEELLAAYRRHKWSVETIMQTAPQCKNYDFYSKWKSGVAKGCSIEGHLSINKVQGHIYIVPARMNDLMTVAQQREVYPFLRIKWAPS